MSTLHQPTVDKQTVKGFAQVNPLFIYVCMSKAGPNAHHIHTQTEQAHPQSIQLGDKSEDVHQLFNTVAEKCEAIQKSFGARGPGHLHIYSSIHKNAYQAPASPAFPLRFLPESSKTHRSSSNGYYKMIWRELQKVEIEKCQTRFIQRGYGSVGGTIWRTRENIWRKSAGGDRTENPDFL